MAELSDPEELRERAWDRFSRRVARVNGAVRGDLAIASPGGRYLDLAEALLPVASVMPSVSVLSRARPVFPFSALLAMVGPLLTVNGFSLPARISLVPGGHWPRK